MFDADLVDVLASDARALLVFRARMKVGAREIQVDYVILARIEARRIVEIWSAPMDPQTLEAFWVGLALTGSEPPA
ncbi:MAG: hypothetical protein M5U32_12125 [Myxococcota bacterium]|nr:hypothetical protein [Myxococcota bacterium]